MLPYIIGYVAMAVIVRFGIAIYRGVTGTTKCSSNEDDAIAAAVWPLLLCREIFFAVVELICRTIHAVFLAGPSAVESVIHERRMRKTKTIAVAAQPKALHGAVSIDDTTGWVSEYTMKAKSLSADETWFMPTNANERTYESSDAATRRIRRNRWIKSQQNPRCSTHSDELHPELAAEIDADIEEAMRKRYDDAA